MFQSKKFILKGRIFYGFISETTRGEKKIRNNYSQVEENNNTGRHLSLASVESTTA